MMNSQSNIECGTEKSGTEKFGIESIDSSSTSKNYNCCGNRVPKNQFTCISQIILIYAIIATSIVHLSIQSQDRELWLILLSSSLGYILPSPGLKFSRSGQKQPEWIDSKK